MPPSQTVQNNFKEGLKTEFTGLNFPENAATDTANCVYTLIGDVQRRGGINYEANNVLNSIDVSSVANSSFRWLNAGGDGTSQILVQQIGSNLYFYKSSSATLNSPLSTTLLPSVINILLFTVANATANPALSECQYAIGNGYLFVFHPNCDPFYCVFTNNTVTANAITLQQRDVTGIAEPGVSDDFRPTVLTNEHRYNLLNQGWTQGVAWTAVTTYNGQVPLNDQGTGPNSITFTLSSQSNTTAVTNGSTVQVVMNPCAKTGPNNNNLTGQVTLTGVVSGYTGTSAITVTFGTNSRHELNVTGAWSSGNFFPGAAQVNMSLVNVGFITTWQALTGNYPSNSDIWWLYKDTNQAFNPTTTLANVQTLRSPAPKGAYILNVFSQDRSQAASIAGLTVVSTQARPSTGAFYQGRVWYAGVNSFQAATGDQPTGTTWTENIYFSQIVQSPVNFGKCYQNNDPTSQNLFTLESSDGGVITIPGCGAVYKLFALRFGLLVFAANGVWFISGSTGIGFTANDFTVTKISSIQSISGASFIEVQGFPFFWNQEGIYEVTPTQQAGSAHSPDIQLDVRNICLGTILTFYSNIPLISKVYARGDYHQLDYIVQWCFRSTNENGINNRYNFDTILNYNVVTKAFYPYTLPNSLTTLNDIKYIQNPGGSGAPGPILKYFLSTTSNTVTFGEENDFTRFVDFFSENGIGYNYNSFFVTGYMLPGGALRRFQIPYIYMFSRNPLGSQCLIQAIWDYAGGSAEGKQSTRQNITMGPNSLYRKVRLRGRGVAVQLKISSIQGQPFDLMGWSVLDQINQAV
jgi:hypothetical protein